MDIKQLRQQGWHADTPFGYPAYVVPFEDVQDFIVKLKLDFEERLSNAVNDAYDEGYLNGYDR